MKKWTLFALISIFMLAVILRLFQLLNFSVWGSDTGEYYYLTERLADSGQVSFEYDGWGFGYPYFPAMFIILSGFANISGISVFEVLLFVIPIISGLSVILIYLITKRILKNFEKGAAKSPKMTETTTDMIALVAAAFLAVALPNVFITSHPMPGTLGEIIMLFCILLLLKSYENLKFAIPLILFTAVLIFTHHLSTLFLLFIVIFIIIFRVFSRVPDDVNRTKIDFGYITFLLTGMLIYWIFVAVPFKERVLENAIGFPAEIGVVLAYGALIMLLVVIWARKYLKWEYIIKTRQLKVLVLRFTLFLICAFIIFAIVGSFGVLGTNLEIEAIALFVLVPLVIFLAFSTFGHTFVRLNRDGMFVAGWVSACAILLCISVITESHEILAYRTFQYIFTPVAIFIGTGFVMFFKCIEHNQGSEVLKYEMASTTAKPRRVITPYKTAAGVVIIILVLAGAALAYPPKGLLSGFQEGTNEPELEGCYWLRESVEDDAVVASDHRLSSMAFGFGGANATWENAPKTLQSENLDEIAGELNATKTPSGKKAINYVLLSQELKDGVTLAQWVTVEPMSDEAYDKFQTYPFYKVFDNGDVEIYLVDWH